MIQRQKMGKEKKRKTLSQEFTLLTVVTSVGTLFLLGVVLISVFSFLFLQNAKEDMQYVLDSTNEQIQSHIQFISDGAVSIRHNPLLEAFLKNESYDQENAEKQLGYMMELFSAGNLAEQTPFVESVHLFNKVGKELDRRYYPLTVLAAKEEKEICQHILTEFYEENCRYQSYIRNGKWYLCFTIYDESMNNVGICMVQIEREAIKEIFSAVEEYQDWGWEIKGNDEILFSDGRKIEGDNLVYSSADGEFDIQISLVVGKENLYVVLRPTLFAFLFILLLALVLAAALAFVSGYRLSKPLKKVRESMHEFGEEQFDIRMDDFQIQEFHDISVVFNEMADKIQHLILEVYEKELTATRLQVKYLQAQITPHFQFNILSMLSLKAKLAGNEELYQCLRAFSELVRGKIFRKKEIMIPVAEELELVEFYLYLQNSRFQDKITYEIICPEEKVKENLIPRLLIEPLVENAVSHGLEPKQGSGKVQVILYEQNKRLHIIVEDDGVGFEEEDMETVREKEGHTHTGLENTKRLLYILYGENHTWKVTGKKGEGTTVEIVIPSERRADDVERDGSR